MCDLELLMTGAFSPLRGFMTNPDYEAALDRMQLQDGTIWPIPVCLDMTEVAAGQLEVGQAVVLRDAEGFILAVMHATEIWPIDKERGADDIWYHRYHKSWCGLPVSPKRESP